MLLIEKSLFRPLKRAILRLVGFEKLEQRVERLQVSLGRVEARQLQMLDLPDVRQNEFTAFSAWGEDGIIQFLLRHVRVPRKIFVEFGVWDYHEANTRFLLLKDNWTGLVMDSSAQNIDRIVQDPGLCSSRGLKAIPAFVTRENINSLLECNGITGDIGLLSIDIDGNDYWVWDAINVITPAVVIVEYNHRFGRERAVTIPYRSDFDRRKAHFSMIYFGASLRALCLLAGRKGYSFVGCDSCGVDAFFVRKDLKPDYLAEKSVEDGYAAGQFKESRNEHGKLSLLSPEEEQQILSSLPLVEVT